VPSFRLEEILAKLRPDMLEDEADVRPSDSYAGCVARLDQSQMPRRTKRQKRRAAKRNGQRGGVPQANATAQRSQNRDGERNSEEAWRQRDNASAFLAELRKDQFENAAILA
jgi:hypothetical protein